MEPQPQEAKTRYWQGIYLDSDESPVTTIPKHPIGALAIAIAGGAAIAAIILLSILLFPGSFVDNPSAVAGGILLLSSAIAFIVLIAIYIYRQNKLLVTNKHVAEVTQRSLVSHKISQLSMKDVEDASADQRGILATTFNYGTLTIQTAGALDNFIFTLCPNPSQYADQILQAKEVPLDDGK